MMHFTAVNGLSNLQSSLYAKTGTFSLTLMYIGMIISCLFFAVPTIRFLGVKWSMSSALLLYIPYIAAQYWPIQEVMWPAAYLAGTGSGILWTAKTTYLFFMARDYVNLTFQSKDPEQIQQFLGRFLAIFFSLYELSQVWGNLISNKVLSKNNISVEFVHPRNNQTICGAKMCFYENTQSSQQASDESMQMLTGIYIGVMLLGMGIFSIIADQVPRLQDESRSNKSKLNHFFGLFFDTMKQYRYLDQILLAPLTFWIGSIIAFLTADFTAAYVSCSLGISSVGSVLLVYGVSNTLMACSCAVGLLRYIDRRILSFSAIIVYIAVIIALFVWNPLDISKNPQPEIYFYIIAALIGGCEVIINIVINTLPALLFPKNADAAFSNVVFGKASGYIVSYSYSSFICVYVKLIILMTILVIGGICLGVLEILLKRKTALMSLEASTKSKKRNKKI